MDSKVLNDEQADVLDTIQEDLEEIEDEAVQADDMVEREKAETALQKLSEFREAVKGI
jgi:hypothetical protein